MKTALSESWMREICTSSLMSGVWKRSMAGYCGTGNRKGRQHATPDLNHRVTPRLYSLFLGPVPLTGGFAGRVDLGRRGGGSRCHTLVPCFRAQSL